MLHICMKYSHEEFNWWEVSSNDVLGITNAFLWNILSEQNNEIIHKQYFIQMRQSRHCKEYPLVMLVDILKLVR